MSESISISFYTKFYENLMSMSYIDGMISRMKISPTDIMVIDVKAHRKFLNEAQYQTLIEVLECVAINTNSYIITGIIAYQKNKEKYICSVLIDDEGNYLGKSMKDYDVEGLSHATHFPVFETKFGKIGIPLSDDLWSIEIPRIFALKGAELLIVPDSNKKMDENALSFVRGISVYNCLNIIYFRQEEQQLHAILMTPHRELFNGNVPNGVSYQMDLQLIEELREPDLSFQNTLWWLLWGRKPQYYQEILSEHNKTNQWNKEVS